jgi:uncharacterized membrane protein
MMLSVGMPIFSSPDEYWHYSIATSEVGLPNDTSVYGNNPGNSFGIAGTEKYAYQTGRYYDAYFVTKVDVHPISAASFAIRGKGGEYPPISSSQFWTHLLPGIGAWIGYHIYPSVGVMFVFGRLFASSILVIALSLIIKYLRRGKLLFMLIFLSPVALQQFASFSYDGLSFLVAALIIATAINIADRMTFRWQDFLKIGILTVVTYFGAKQNFLELLLIFPVLFVGISVYKNREKTEELRKKRGYRYFARKNIIYLSLFAVVITVLMMFILFAGSGGVITTLERYLTNFTYNLYPATSIDTMFVQTIPGVNNIPEWLTWVWFAALLVIGLSEEKFVRSQIISWGALIVVIFQVLAVYQGITGYIWGRITPQVQMEAIQGVQGRYFTPVPALLLLFAANNRFNLGVVSFVQKGSYKLTSKLKSYRTLMLSVIGLAVFSNILLIVDTLRTVTQLPIN